MGADADALCGAGYGQRSAERTNQRNGYRPRQFDTRAGSLDLAIPKLRHGSYFPDWLVERRKRADRALTTACFLVLRRPAIGARVALRRGYVPRDADVDSLESTINSL
jgi:Transposase, Mutator family